MKSMILAAGFGTRLWPLTEDRTKPAIPFLNRPLIAYCVEYLRSHGLCEIIINLHHQPESIQRALGDGSEMGVSIQYSYEEEILGTSGALDRVREMLLDDDFVVINGKIITDIDLGAAIEAHRRQKALATLVLKENIQREHFSIVEIDSRGWITRFAGFPEGTDRGREAEGAMNAPGRLAPRDRPPLLFTGIQVLSPRIFEYIPRGRFSHSTTDVYPRAIAANEAVVAHVAREDWFELSTLRRYFEASLLFMRKQHISMICGAGCSIDSGAVVEDAVLWNGVTISSGAQVREAVLADGVCVPPGAVIERAAVVRGEIVTEVERGEIMGENLVVPF